ncbi:MAG: class I SAM-dependent methyltransferase [Deltaproteobacteria bacterium]|nr:class I SAM-dependent methyltransferase [Deltaproteobacteria bacterium]
MLTVDFREISLKAGMRVLDAGCGGGRHLCEAMGKSGVSCVGVDLNWADLCRTKGFLSLMDQRQSGGWIVARADVTRLPFSDDSFDAVICSEVLEHVVDSRRAITELLRVLKPMGDLVITVPRFLPERICWALSRAYHHEPGGHIRIYKKGELLNLLKEAGADCRRIRYRHGLHAPYWWLRCLVGHKNEKFPLVKAYRTFLEWGIVRRSSLTAAMDRILNPLIGKSIIFYMKKGYR